MKRGFTLIELLAVILILGIIALIAIPTVNKILNEARQGAFKTGVDNILKTTQTQCQTSQIKNRVPVTTYYFRNGKSIFDIEIKGTIPKDGYIILDNNCEVLAFNVSDGTYDYKSDNVNEVEDYMIMKPQYIMVSSYGTEYKSYASCLYRLYIDHYSKTDYVDGRYTSTPGDITSVNFIKTSTVPEGALEVHDISQSQNGKVKSWLIQNMSGYDLYVGADKPIQMNPDSTSLFYDLAAKSYDLSNLYSDYAVILSSMFLGATGDNVDLKNMNTSNVASFNSMFSHTDFKSLNLSHFNTENAVDMDSMFVYSDQLTTLDISNFDTSNVVNMHQMFMHTKSLTSLDVSKFNTSKVKNMRGMFIGLNVESLDLRHFDVSNVENMEILFAGSGISNDKLKYIDISTWDTSKVTNMTSMFRNRVNLQEVKIGDGWNTSNATVVDMFTGVTKGDTILVR